MTNPTISKATKIYLANVKKIKTLEKQAIQETHEYLSWLFTATEVRLRPILGNDLKRHNGQYQTVFYLPEWRQGTSIYGVYFGSYADPQKRVLTQVKEGPFVGVCAWPSDDDQSDDNMSECEKLEAQLGPIVRPLCKLLISDDEDVWWCEVPVSPDGDLLRWGTDVLNSLESIARDCGDALKAFTPRA